MPDLSALQMIIGFLLLLTPVVFFHELGHYLVGKWAGIKVECTTVTIVLLYLTNIFTVN